jgi:hypothetical protein
MIDLRHDENPSELRCLFVVRSSGACQGDLAMNGLDSTSVPRVKDVELANSKILNASLALKLLCGA